jgi:hypothetical protein
MTRKGGARISTNSETDAETEQPFFQCVYDPIAPTADVIFVHGLGGHWKHSWMSDKKDEATFWPKWVSSHIPNAKVWSLEYPSSLTRWGNSGKGMDLPERALQILDYMESSKFGDRPIVFIAHSLGGLLIKKILHLAKGLGKPGTSKANVIEQTRGVMFFATPHHGSNLARLAIALRLLGFSRVVGNLKGGCSNLDELGNWYKANVENLNIRTASYRENKKFRCWFWVVSPVHADPGVATCQTIAIDANHFDVCKPQSQKNPVFVGAIKFITDCLSVTLSSEPSSHPQDEPLTEKEVPLGVQSSTGKPPSNILLLESSPPLHLEDKPCVEVHVPLPENDLPHAESIHNEFSYPIIDSLYQSIRNLKEDITKSLEAAELVRKRNLVFEAAVEILGPFCTPDRPTVIQMTSLIGPETWKNDGRWIDYHKKIRNIARKGQGTIARRIHVIHKSDLHKPEALKTLFNLMMAECVCGIRSRALCLSREDLEPIKKGGDQPFYRLDDFNLFDCATLTTLDGQYGVIFSDIKPYFMANDQAQFTICKFSHKISVIYYVLRANFYRGWHLRDQKTLFSLPALNSHRVDTGFGPLVDYDLIKTFLPGAIPRDKASAKVIEGILFTEAKNFEWEGERERMEEDLESKIRGAFGLT